MMQVKATRMGYMYHRRFREGDIIDLKSEKDFSPKWMEKIDLGRDDYAPMSKRPQKPANVAKALSQVSETDVI